MNKNANINGLLAAYLECCLQEFEKQAGILTPILKGVKTIGRKVLGTGGSGAARVVEDVPMPRVPRPSATPSMRPLVKAPSVLDITVDPSKFGLPSYGGQPTFKKVNGLWVAFDEQSAKYLRERMHSGNFRTAPNMQTPSALDVIVDPRKFSKSNYGGQPTFKKVNGLWVAFDEQSAKYLRKRMPGGNVSAGNNVQRPMGPDYQPAINPRTGQEDYINMRGSYPSTADASENARVIARPDGRGGMIYSSPQDYTNAQRVELFMQGR